MVLLIVLYLNVQIVIRYQPSEAGGRGKHHDFDVYFTNSNGNQQHYCVEFKYGSNSIKDCPQFVSPSKPSRYFTQSFEEFYYNNYLDKVLLDERPSFDVYSRQVHGPSPECLALEKAKYDAGCKRSSKFTNNQSDIDYYELCNNVSKQAISEFISQTDINLTALNEYLLETQNGKVYMLCNHEGLFNLEVPDESDYIIKQIINKTENKWIGETMNGNTIKILLRWKNGGGVAYPALQIS